MTILESMEVRWFLPPDPARDALLTQWFDSATVEGEREDTYLRTGRPDLGIKVRRASPAAAKLETKYLIGTHGSVAIAPSMSGRLERWQKLSMKVDEPSVPGEHGWVVMRKDRRMRKFAFDGGHAFEVGPTEQVAAGAGLELTILRFVEDGQETVTSTLGIEAFGPSNDLLTIFEHACRRAFADAPAVTLHEVDSLSYPAWLARRASATKLG